jgi:hypothetical protein
MNRTSVFANPKSMTIDRVLMGGRIWLIAFIVWSYRFFTALSMIKIRDRLTRHLDGYH